MLHIKNLSKRYGNHVVFQGLTHTFAPGCMALCEESSTGKSTLLGIIAGVIAADNGEVIVNGVSVTQAPKQASLHVAYVPEDCLQFPDMTGRELIEQVAKERNTAIIDSVLTLAQKLGLEPHLDKRFEQMSKGTRRKVYLCAAEVGEPQVVVADGPTIGLDAPATAALVEQFKKWAQSRVVLFASHEPDFVEACGAQRLNVNELGSLSA